MRLVLRRKVRKAFGIPVIILWVLSMSAAIVLAASYINKYTVTYTVNDNGIFQVYNGTIQVLELYGVGGEVFDLTYTFANQANQNLQYKFSINCTNVEENDVFLSIDGWNSTSGRVETSDVQVGAHQTREGVMRVQFHPSYSGNGQCQFGTSSGSFTWGDYQ